jgi:hypothetical protein
VRFIAERHYRMETLRGKILGLPVAEVGQLSEGQLFLMLVRRFAARLQRQMVTMPLAVEAGNVTEAESWTLMKYVSSHTHHVRTWRWLQPDHFDDLGTWMLTVTEFILAISSEPGATLSYRWLETCQARLKLLVTKPSRVAGDSKLRAASPSFTHVSSHSN